MMRKKLMLLMTAFALAGVLQAQELWTIKGNVRMEGKPSATALVSLFRLKDKILLRSALPDSNGHYVVTGKGSDSVFLVISHVGFASYQSLPFPAPAAGAVVTHASVDLRVGKENALDNITVVGKLPFVEKKIDRTVVNPDALLTNAGSNALEVLERSPGVQVDMNGNISLQGKPGVMVFVDDKPTYMTASDLANYLRSLPASSIGTIELMTNPPAKYDAAGNAGIINIKLKRNNVKGFSGGFSLAYGQGRYARTNNSLNLNYRINKLSVFSNLSYNINNSYQDLYINRVYLWPNGAVNNKFSQNSYIKPHTVGMNAKVGFDYFLDKKTTIGAVFTGFSNHSISTNANLSRLTDRSDALLGTVQADSRIDRKLLNGGVNVNLTRKIADKGSELSFNADYVAYDVRTHQSLVNQIFKGDGSFVNSTTLISELPSTLKIYTAKADYMLPVHNRGKFEAGFKTSLVNTTNVADFYDLVNDSLTVNNQFTNSFTYKENINAAYVNFSYNTRKLSFQAGLRVENTNISGLQFGNAVQKDSSFTRHYTSVFPTFFLLYRLDSLAKNQLAFNLGRRINRPNYKDLNPFTYPLDLFTLYGGNPFLRPTFSQSLEASHIYRNKYTTTLSVSYARDVINETIQQENGIFYSRPGNFGSQWNYGISFNGSFQIRKWWSIQLYSELMHTRFRSDVYGQELKNEGTYWYIGPVNQFPVTNKLSFELAGTYTTSVRLAQFITVPVWTVRAGVGLKIMKNQGSLKLNVNDVFFTNQPGGEIIALLNSSASWQSYLDTRVATLTFSYKFSKGKLLPSRNAGSSNTEKDRVKY